MKLPSIQLLIDSFFKTVLRFPMVLASAVVCTTLAILLVHGHNDSEWQSRLIRALMVCSMGVPFFFFIHIYFEKNSLPVKFLIPALAFGAGVLVLYYFSMGKHPFVGTENIYRFFFWSAGLHLLVAFSAFFTEDEINGFWQFNKQMFLRFLISGLYAGVLFVGLAGALLAIHTLFNVTIKEKVYADLFITLSGIFHPLFFLSGIESPVNRLNDEHDYPKGLKVFTQYVLLPLVTVYLVILYVYTGKILVEMNLPKGWVANLILGFSVTGMFSLLLVYPVRGHEGNKWMQTFSRLFYYSLLPLIVLLFVAIGTRIREYGVTVERYIVAMLGVWLLLITIYFIFSKTKNIILIPITLALFLFGSCFGPWGMLQVSERSQTKRLIQLLEKNGAISDGKLKKMTEEEMKKINTDEEHQIRSIFSYISENHGLECLKDWMPEACSSAVLDDSVSGSRNRQLTLLYSCMGWKNNEYTDYSDEEKKGLRLRFTCKELSNVQDVSLTGYDRLFKFELNNYGNTTFPDPDEKLEAEPELKNNEIKLYHKKRLVLQYRMDSLAFRLKALPSSGGDQADIPAKEMTIETENESGQQIKILIREMDARFTGSDVHIRSLYGYALVREK